MKKTITIIMLIFAVAAAFAQDTLEYGDLPYYYNNYFPHCFWDNGCNNDSIAYWYAWSVWTGSYRTNLCVGQTYITDDTIKVYGIAATYNDCNPIDQMPEVAIYQYEPDSTLHARFGGGAVTELGRTRVMSKIRYYTYHAEFAGYSPTTNEIVRLDQELMSVVPAYEYYFSCPVVVHDTFYVGGIHETSSQPIRINCGKAIVEVPTYGNMSQIHRHGDTNFLIIQPKEKFDYGGFFPIIRPLRERDTTVNDSTAIAAVDYGSRVSLAPNPTDGRFTVTSDDGLRAIEVYDMTGRAVMRLNASGSRVEFDASALPKGCYILATTTANGVARKKLILR